MDTPPVSRTHPAESPPPEGELVHNFYDPDALPDQVAASRRSAAAARRVIAGLSRSMTAATATSGAMRAMLTKGEKGYKEAVLEHF